MDPVKFGALVRSLEERARRYPRLYRTQVAAIAALGYAYVLGVLVLLTVAELADDVRTRVDMCCSWFFTIPSETMHSSWQSFAAGQHRLACRAPSC